MDMSQYKDEFVSEARDHLDNLNTNLLLLEKNSNDVDVINSIFRSFHTLKGNAATMGFIPFSEAAHVLENLLDKLRKKEITSNGTIMDVLFQGCDFLEKGLELIAQDASDSIDAKQIIASVNPLLGGSLPSQEVSKETSLIPELYSLSKAEQTKLTKLKKTKPNVFRITVTFDKENPLRSAKVLILLRELESKTTLLSSVPKKAAIAKGELETYFDVVVLTKEKQETIEAICQKISGFIQVSVLDLETPFKEAIQSTKSDSESALLSSSSSVETSSSLPSVMPTTSSASTSSISTDTKKQLQTVKVDIKRLDNLLNLVGELLISKIRLEQISKKHSIKELDLMLTELDRLTTDIQDEVMQERMIPIGNIFNRYPRMVRDLAKKENKKIELYIEGDEIEFDRTILDEIGDPLVHLLRNSVDHGIETLEDRTKSGKDEVGIIRLVATREKNKAIVFVSDDGYGIDPQKIKESMIKKGVLSSAEANQMSDAELQRLIFKPGISTNDVVTEVSGRGVGLDVVETKINSLGGLVKLESEVGKGTMIKLELPLTVAIISALLVNVSEQVYAIPLSQVDQITELKKSEIKQIQKQDVFVLRGIELPLLWLHDLLNLEKTEKEDYTVVIIDKNDGKVGLVIDDIISQQQILIKTLDDLVKKVKGVAGATILGDGSVALILDVATLI